MRRIMSRELSIGPGHDDALGFCRPDVIDPLVVTEQYGTDAIRLAFLMSAAPGTDIVLSTDRMESTRAFADRSWNPVS